MSFNEYAAVGFMILPWWTWPCIAVTVVCSILVVMRYDAWKDERAHAKTGPYPCLAHIGATWDQMDLWCWLREGHDGPHKGPWDVIEAENVTDDPESRPEGLCSVDMGCVRDWSHTGPHEY